MSQQSTPAIAIVGGGFSGAMVAVHLLRMARQPLTIYLIEPRSTVGCGVAYSTALTCHLMNVPAGKISAFADQPNHFLQWAQQISSIAGSVLAITEPLNDLNPQSFVPRKLYGRYVQAVVAEAEATAVTGVRLERVTDAAIAIKPGDRTTILLQSGITLQVDQVVLALGNSPPRHLAIANSSFYQSDRYIHSGWSNLPHALASDDPVVLIGSGLTAVDWAIALHQQGHRGTIHLISRRGLLPQQHALPQSHPLSSLSLFNLDSQATVRTCLRRVRQAVVEAMAQGKDWRSVIDGLRPLTNSIWQSLSPVEKRRFLRHLRSYWDTHRHRVAPAIAQILEDMRRSGQLQIHAGRIQAFQESATGINVSVRQRGSQASTPVNAAWVVNCTGSECDYRKLNHPLIQQLLQDGLVQPDALAIGLETDSNGALIDADCNPSTWLYTLGSTRRGQLWETTAIPEIREQARGLAATLLRSIPTLATVTSSKLTASIAVATFNGAEAS
ncbi:FAD/NAD(P)-binding protein [Oscillatoria sp. FACHB-1407]|uniref:FAD/NAD(P)-binding protein n=1 Tax=Oscillatoria sp. FACHB-1407 TaxID=2692847 RepID=UPI001689D408|nr:FAD/NAD(P)-binding protein [Oscillatoria sp. FACHB-1407]MBD2460552.1 FAD/NAD(P)-binding protein [Oscillatoria sp. FACHB-1407]